MSNFTVFKFEELDVRIEDKDGEPWFVAKDVGEILGIENVRQNLQSFPDDEKGVYITSTPGGNQKITLVSEAGLYRLIFKSRKPNAEKFKTWVVKEVLPSIRKTGSYSIQSQPTYSSALRRKCLSRRKKSNLLNLM